MEDGAPGHKGFSKACRKKNDVETLEWVPQSPDLNPIEVLWGDMEVQLGKKYGRLDNIPDLQEKLEEWNKISKDRLLALVRSMPDRLKAVIQANGEATPY
ncbi:hypothetical protein BDZ91DRAFT_730538 [Kalaharituber pfeilii]|nr:hypothetical protein BDZ91DRAFT_730538 [Kalaharituber pfeilii]